MWKRLLVAALFALIAAGMSFYLAYTLGIVYMSLNGPANPATAYPLQDTLRHVALPISVALAVGVFVFVFARWGKRMEDKKPGKVICIR